MMETNINRWPETGSEKLARQLRTHGRQLELAQSQLLELHSSSEEYVSVYFSMEALQDGLYLPCERKDLIKALNHKIQKLRMMISDEQIIIEELNRAAAPYLI